MLKGGLGTIGRLRHTLRQVDNLDFSRAEKAAIGVLYQGTALAVPQGSKIDKGFSP
jgi:hypothetical protein